MCQADDGGRAEAQVLETEPDVEQHQNQSNTDREQSIALHLVTDGGADGLGSNAVLVYFELFDQLVGELRALVSIKDDGLEDDEVEEVDEVEVVQETEELEDPDNEYEVASVRIVQAASDCTPFSPAKNLPPKT